MVLALTIFCMPKAKTIVTTAGKPSGIAATPKLIANIKFSINPSIHPWPSTGLWMKIKPANWTTNKTATMAIVKIPKNLDNLANCFCKGVSSSSPSDNNFAILPVSVFIPVKITTPSPRP